MRVLALLVSAVALRAMEVVALPGQSPIINFRFVFRCGSLNDPAGKEGVAALTAAMLARGGSAQANYSEILEKLYPMAAVVADQTDQEMLTISGMTHLDNLERYYATLREMLLQPGWRAEDLKRLRDDQLTFLRVSLRQNNDEELGKEVLYNLLQGTAHPVGRISSLEKLTVADLKAFYKQHLTQANLTIASAGLTVEDVNRAVKKHLRKDRLEIVAVAEDAEGLQRQLLGDGPSPMTYNSPKLADILEEDKVVSTRKLRLKAAQVRIVPVEKFFQ